jgi:hypothetical protein
VGIDCREDRIDFGLLGQFEHDDAVLWGWRVRNNIIACCRAGLGESLVRLAGKGCSGTGATAK